MSIPSCGHRMLSSETVWAITGAAITAGTCVAAGTGALPAAASAIAVGALLGVAVKLFGLVAEWAGHVAGGAAHH